MIDPNLKAKDRIYSELPEELKELMRQYVLDDEVHNEVLKNIKAEYYRDKTAVAEPKFIIVLGQTGSGKSNLTKKIMQDNKNIVLIDSDKYKAYRPDNEEILSKHLTKYAFLTAPDSYQHRDEMLCDTMEQKYNILLECATSQKDGMFIDINDIKKAGYKLEIAVLAVSDLNSALSIHERYESQMQLNYSSAKLTGITRHDDSYKSLITSVQNVQNDSDIKIKVYERGEVYPFIPKMIYSTDDVIKKYSCPVEAIRTIQGKDRKKVIPQFDSRYKAIYQQMINRGAPEKQMQQLELVRSRYEAEIKKEIQRTK